ncbi:hypothetical protein MTO96_032574 [Rhipicephalus appendiculatus]
MITSAPSGRRRNGARISAPSGRWNCGGCSTRCAAGCGSCLCSPTTSTASPPTWPGCGWSSIRCALSCPPLYWAIERQLFRLLLLMVSFWSWSAEYYVDEVGEDVSECYSDRTLVLVNHQSTADVPLLMASFQGKRSVTEHLMWIMDRLFKYTNFGAVSMTHGDFFITQGKDTRNTQLQRLRDHIAEVYLRRGLKWIVLFPEGGFLHKRRATSQRYARANGYPILEHVTLPRVGAMKTVLETLSSENLEKTHKGEEAIKWVVDITIGYPDMGKPLDLFVISGGFRKQCVVHMHYRRFPISEVPIHDSEALTKWLYDRWAEKEDLLDIFYRTGRFPGRLHRGRGEEERVPARTTRRLCARRPCASTSTSSGSCSCTPSSSCRRCSTWPCSAGSPRSCRSGDSFFCAAERRVLKLLW